MNLRRDERDTALLAKAAVCAELPRLGDITAEALAELSRRHGLDFATALLFDRIVHSDRCGWRWDVNHESKRETCRSYKRYPWAIVPGAFYRENAKSGADGAAVLAAARGLATRGMLIPTASFGSLADNARMIRDWLTSHPHDSTVLISLSKGSREVRYLLDSPNAEQTFANVRLWINLTGLVSGSPLVHWLLAKPWRSWGVRAMFWLRRYSFADVAELDRTPELLERPWGVAASDAGDPRRRFSLPASFIEQSHATWSTSAGSPWPQRWRGDHFGRRFELAGRDRAHLGRRSLFAPLLCGGRNVAWRAHHRLS